MTCSANTGWETRAVSRGRTSLSPRPLRVEYVPVDPTHDDRNGVRHQRLDRPDGRHQRLDPPGRHQRLDRSGARHQRFERPGLHQRVEDPELDRDRGPADHVRLEKPHEVLHGAGVLRHLERPRVVEDVRENDGDLDGEKRREEVEQPRDVDEDPQQHLLDPRSHGPDNDEPTELERERPGVEVSEEAAKHLPVAERLQTSPEVVVDLGTQVRARRAPLKQLRVGVDDRTVSVDRRRRLVVGVDRPIGRLARVGGSVVQRLGARLGVPDVGPVAVADAHEQVAIVERPGDRLGRDLLAAYGDGDDRLVGRRISVHDGGDERRPLPQFGSVDAEQVGHRRGDGVESDLAVDTAAVDTRDVDDQRNPDQFVVELGVVGEVTVVLELLAVVARHHDRGLVVEAVRRERLEHPADAVVDLAGRGLIQRSKLPEGPVVDLPPQPGSGVGVEHPVGTQEAVRDLPDVPRRRDVGRVGVHVVNPQEEGLLGVVEEVGRGVLDVEHPGGVQKGAVVGVAREPRPDPSDRRGCELEPRLHRRVGGEVPAVDARPDACDERLELVEPLVVPPM